MPRAVMDISITGDKALARTMSRILPKAANKVMRQALRASAKRIKKRVVANIDGGRLGVVTGEYVYAMKKAKIKSASRSRKSIRLGFAWPTRAELEISPDDKYFFPAAIEFGHKKKGGGRVAAKPHIRPAVDEHKTEEFAKIRTQLFKGLAREGRKGNITAGRRLGFGGRG